MLQLLNVDLIKIKTLSRMINIDFRRYYQIDIEYLHDIIFLENFTTAVKVTVNNIHYI